MAGPGFYQVCASVCFYPALASLLVFLSHTHVLSLSLSHTHTLARSLSLTVYLSLSLWVETVAVASLPPHTPALMPAALLNPKP